MPISNLLPINRNPASIVQDTMPTPARNHNFDVEFTVAGLGSDEQKFHYYVLSADKPKFDFNYEEINHYGYRYNILTGITYPELSMTIMDDSDNKSLSFLYAYLNAIVNSDGGSNPSSRRFSRFNDSNILATLDSNPEYANIRALGGNEGSGVVIQEIKLHQYVSYGLFGDARGKIRTWTFKDPQLTNIDMSTFSVDDEDIGTFSLSFNYKNISFDLDTKQYPDTPFDLLRAATFADLAEGIITSSPGDLVKAATNIGAQLATTELNTGALPGVSGGGALAIGESIRLGIKKIVPAVSPGVPIVDNEKNKNGYVPPQNTRPTSPPKRFEAPKVVDQSGKLDKLL